MQGSAETVHSNLSAKTMKKTRQPIADLHSEVMGNDWKYYSSFAPQILEGQQFRAYNFLPESEFVKLLEEKALKGKQVYIDEILYRAHFSALVALARTHTWCKAILAAERANNYFGMCAALRGLLESSADINHSLNPVTDTLAAYFTPIVKHYRSEIKDRLLNMGGIEDALIHFMCARKMNSNEKSMFPLEHKAKEIQAYIEGIKDCEGINEFYRHLCGISHPAADTVVFFEKYDHSNGSLAFSWKSDHSNDIQKTSLDFRRCIDFVVAVGYNFPLLLLGVLNEFQMPKVSTNQIHKFKLDWIPRWEKLKLDIQQSGIAKSGFDNVVAFHPK